MPGGSHVTHHPACGRATLVILLGTALVISLACEEDKAPTDPQIPDSRTSDLAAAASGSVSALGTIPLPINQSFSGAGLAFGITQTGTGGTGMFRVNNANSQAPALEVVSSGQGPTAHFDATNGTTGQAGFFFEYDGSGLNALFSSSSLSGGGIQSESQGNLTAAGTFNNSGKGPALRAESNGGPVATFTNLSPGTGIRVRTLGTGWAGDFVGQQRGVRITTNFFGAGLQVVNGSKNAIVGTADGARALYSEEATEVWFADYGFGKLENGRARILIDPGYAQTVSVDEPYHVFVQPYGNAELYVTERTNLGFVVKAKDGHPDVEFSYRVVAKRRGFESARLERADWADNIAQF